MQKFKLYILGLIVSILTMFPITYIYTTYKQGVLFFSAFIIAFCCSFIGFFIWRKYYKEKFENFLVFCTYFLISSIFIYFGPVTLDRSLSAFIYFYSVENTEINTDIFEKKYFDKYIQRRFDDGEKIGFLKCEKNICKPTLKTKLVYYSLYPCGKLSKTLTEYDKFKAMLEEKKQKRSN